MKKLGWELEKLYAQWQKMQDNLQEKLSAVIHESGNVEVLWNNSMNVRHNLEAI